MPTKKPRLVVTLEADLDQAITELAEATGTSKSSLAAQLLRESMPAMKILAKAAQAAKAKQADTFDLLTQALFEAQAKAGQMGLELLEEKGKLRRAQGALKAASAENEKPEE